MAKCQNITPTRKKICVGALRYRININNRALVGIKTENNATHSEVFTLFKTVKASIETRKNQVFQTLDGVAIDPELIVTHIFMTRFTSGFSTEQFIEFKNLNYKILKVENVDEADLWIRLSANLRGDFTKAGAQ